MICHTANCQRATRPGQAYCGDCLPIVLRTGRPPVIAREPEWVSRAKAKALSPKVYA